MGTAQVQGRLWGAAAADWSQFAEPGQTPFYEAVFDATGVGAGTRLLDAGCGAGLALQLAHGRGATVTGLDASAGLLAVARQRVPSADLRQGELAELPYEDGSFDVVTAFNSVQYAADPVDALRELRRVVGPGGQVAVVTWAEAERCETRSVLAAVGALLPPPPPGAGGPFALSSPGTLEGLAEAAGLTPKRTRCPPRTSTRTSTRRSGPSSRPDRPARRSSTPACCRPWRRSGTRSPAPSSRTAATGRTTRSAT